MTEQSPMSMHAVAIERVFDAQRELVRKMWTDPDEIAKRWGPEGFTTPRESIEYDLRPGGTSRLTMVGPDGEEDPGDGQFTVVEPPARLAMSEQHTCHPMIESSETTIEFMALDEGRTKVVLTPRVSCVEELVAMARAGWASRLGKLERLLAG